MPFGKINAIFLGIILLFSISMAASPLYMEMQGKDFISNANAFDTLVSATDSSTLKASWTPAQGWEHFIVWSAFTGTGSDSVAVVPTINCYSPSGVLVYAYPVDTLTSATGGQLTLPVGSSACGYTYGLKLKAITGIGTQVILNRFYLGYRK